MEKILVVDDEQSLREVLSIMLKRAGYAVTIAMDGEDAVELLQKEIFDLVITDLRMPKVDGLQGMARRVCYAICRDVGFRDLESNKRRVVLLS